MNILENFLRENEGWIKRRINSSTKDYYLRDEIYGNFLLALTEKFIKNDADDFIGYAKIMGVNAPTWYLKGYTKKNKRLVYDLEQVEQMAVPNDSEFDNVDWETIVNKLIEDLKLRKAYGIVKNLEGRLANPDLNAKELVGLIEGQKHDTILQHFTNLRRLIKDGKIVIDKCW